jgi:hypothetical protein
LEDVPDIVEVVKSVELDRAPHPSPLDHPDVVPRSRLKQILVREHARASSVAQKKRDDVQVRLQARCRRCHAFGRTGEGHTGEEIDKYGIKVVSSNTGHFTSQDTS